MKRFVMFLSVILSVFSIANAGVFGDLKDQIFGKKEPAKVQGPIVCEKSVQPAAVKSEVVKDQVFEPGMTVQLNRNMSVAEILQGFSCEGNPIPLTYFNRLNGRNKTEDSAWVGEMILVPTCEQVDSIRRALDVKEVSWHRAVAVAYPTMADDGYFHWRKANADPYDPNGKISLDVTLSRLSLPEDVKNLFQLAYELGDYSSGYIEYRSEWVEMMSGGAKVLKGPKGVRAEIGSASSKYAAVVYTVEYEGNIYELANPSVCHNWMWRTYSKPYNPPPPIVTSVPPIVTPPVVDTTPWLDSIPENEIPVPPPAAYKPARNKIQSNLWSGLTTPLNHGVEGMQYFNSYIGADFHYYFCLGKDFGDPHIGIGGTLNGWGGRGWPKVGYGGVQPDIGFRLVFPWNGGAFTVGPYLGLAWNKAVSDDQYGRYEGRQTTFPLIIERASLDFYWTSVELNWWAQGTQGLRGYKLSTFNGQPLTDVQDPATALNSVGTGLKLFFGSSVETKDVDMGNGVKIPQVVPRRCRVGIFSEFNTTFEGVLGQSLDPAYAVGFGPSFQFPRTRIIISPKLVYLWHFENSRNDGLTGGLQFDWEIVQKFWSPGGNK